jgi:heme/copper-type cytochrome/quinol oxidase subunit 2
MKRDDYIFWGIITIIIFTVMGVCAVEIKHELDDINNKIQVVKPAIVKHDTIIKIKFSSDLFYYENAISDSAIYHTLHAKTKEEHDFYVREQLQSLKRLSKLIW